jgi:hypothetical protein
MNTRIQAKSPKGITAGGFWAILARFDRQTQEQQAMDETAYLMSNRANHEHIMRGIAAFESQENIVDVPLETFRA